MRERIAIDSAPLSETLFAKYFFEVWDALDLSTDVEIGEDDKLVRPTYFRFLTLLSFHVFLREHVDAAVYEVGMGGAYDATNIIERPAATGVTALGIDHVETLGETLAQIAWHKGGIFKPDVPAFSVRQLPDGAAVLEQRATNVGQTLRIVEPSRQFDSLRLLPSEPFQRNNAAMAISLADVVLQKMGQPSIVQETGPASFVREALEQTVFRGRFETLEAMGAIWHLDGAHTHESLQLSGRWFADVADPEYVVACSARIDTQPVQEVRLTYGLGPQESWFSTSKPETMQMSY